MARYTIGWLMDLFVGNSHIEHFEPVYLDDLSQLSYWRLLLYEFARNIAIIGSIMGVITIAIINNKLFNQRVVSLCGGSDTSW